MSDLARAGVEVADRVGVQDLLAARRAQYAPLRVDRGDERVRAGDPPDRRETPELLHARIAREATRRDEQPRLRTRPTQRDLETRSRPELRGEVLCRPEPGRDVPAGLGGRVEERR